MNDAKETRKLAARIQTEAAKHGAVIVARTDDGKTLIAPGYELTLVGIYAEGVKVDWIAEDLSDAQR